MVLDVEAADPDVSIVIEPVKTGRRRRYGEGAIRSGDEVVAFGRTVERPGDRGETGVVVACGKEATSITSELDEAEITGTVTKITIAVHTFGTVQA